MPNQSPSCERATASPPPKKIKSNAKEIDWSDVTDPEERRRIQNRIAQRKFREKAKENREKAERDTRNYENAGNSYQVPSAANITSDEELTGLPWGSLNLCLVISRGHEAESRRSSGKETHSADDSRTSSNYSLSYGPVLHPGNYGECNGGEEMLFEDSSFILHGQSLHPPPVPTFYTY